MRVLIADDNHDTVLSLMMLLREEGHEVEGAYSAADAIVAAGRFKPDAMILDIEMPAMSGYAVAREIRNIFGERSPLLIAITGKWTMPSDRRLAEEVGFDHHLAKPTDPNALLRLLSGAA